MFTACNHNGKHEVDLPGTKATAGPHMVIKHISVKIVRASCIFSVKLLKKDTFYGPFEIKLKFGSPVLYLD